MGALLVVCSTDPVATRARRLRDMEARSPYRGALRMSHAPGGGFSLGIQARHDEATLIESTDLLVGVHGRVYSLATASRTAPPASAALVAALWRQHGMDALSLLDGEYGICVLDAREETAYLCVSLMSSKPLYVAAGVNTVVVASEMRQCLVGANLEARLDPAQIAQGVWLGGPVLERFRTEYQGVDRLLAPKVYRLRPEHAGIAEIGSYWSAPATLSPKELGSRGTVAERVVTSLAAAISVLDGRVAQSLSAGHDSGLLWAVSRRAPPRSGQPRKYSFTWPGSVDDEAQLLRALLSEAGEQAEFIDASTINPIDYMDEHVKMLDRIPSTQTICNGTVLAQRLGADGNSMHLFGIGGEAALMVPPRYLADLLRAGRLVGLVRDLFRFHPYLLRQQSLPRRLRCLLRQALIPQARTLAKLRPDTRLDGVGQRWLELCREAVSTYDHGLRREGYGRGARLQQIDYHSLFSDNEVIEQTFERQGIENVMPFVYQSVMNIGFEVPAEVLCRGLHDKQAHRDAAASLLGARPAWPKFKLTPAPIDRFEKRLLTDLGDPRGWRLVELDIVNEKRAGHYVERLRQGDQVHMPNGWTGVAYAERYLRSFLIR